MRARWAAQFALSTLVLMTGCPSDSDDTDTDASATAATDAGTTAGTEAATDTTTQPTTGGAESTGGTTTGAGAVDYAMDIQPIWDTKCVAGCHTPGGAASMGPVLGADVSYANLVDKQSPTVAMPLVAPGDPDGSYLWHKLNGTQADVGGSGAPMPIGVALDADTLALIEQWITDGAKP